MRDERFEEVYRRHAGSVLRYCTFTSGNREDGEDIAAEVFSRFLRHGDRLEEERVAPWLFTVARNLCASHHRRQARLRLLPGRLASTCEQTAEAWGDPEVWTLLRSLREDARLVIYLHVVEGRTFAEVARLLGRSTSAVKMTLYRSLERVRAEMERGSSPGTSSAGGACDA